MHFLVFIPNAKPAELDTIAQGSGLTSVLGGHNVLPNADGPDGQSGLMLGWTSPHSPLTHYVETEQEWVPSICKHEDGQPIYHVGFWKEATGNPPRRPPVENELRRPYTHAGEWVTLGGQRWKLPTPDTVDAKAVYNDDGTMRWEVIRQYAWVCDEAETLQKTYTEEYGLRKMVYRHEPAAEIGWLLKLLQINYRILPEVADYLDLWVNKNKLMTLFLNTLGLQETEPDDA